MFENHTKPIQNYKFILHLTIGGQRFHMLSHALPKGKVQVLFDFSEMCRVHGLGFGVLGPRWSLAWLDWVTRFPRDYGRSLIWPCMILMSFVSSMVGVWWCCRPTVDV